MLINLSADLKKTKKLLDLEIKANEIKREIEITDKIESISAKYNLELNILLKAEIASLLIHSEDELKPDKIVFNPDKIVFSEITGGAICFNSKFKH